MTATGGGPGTDDRAAVRVVGERVGIGDSGMGGYLARPRDGGPFPAVLIGFEIFGLTAYIRRMADRVAALGFVALAPDFYHREAPGIELAADAAGRERGLELMRGLDRAAVTADMSAARDRLAERSDVSDLRGMLGFSLGGHIACLAGARSGLPVAAFYPGWLTSTEIPLSRPEPTIELLGAAGRVLLLVGGEDRLIDAAERGRIAERFAGTPHELVVYPGAPHGFACDERETYRSGPASDAWDRVAKLLAAPARPARPRAADGSGRAGSPVR